MISKPTICPWLNDKRWVYSITFDEALADLHQFAIPILDEHQVPGHLEVVVGQMGEVRKLGASSFNGYRHMNAGELKDMLARGWGVGNHTWSHEVIHPGDVKREIGQAKDVLEAAIDQPITVYCSAGDNTNMAPHILDACRQYGYLGAMSLTDALNRPGDDDLLWINRTFLHDQGYGPFFSEFDPFRNIAHAKYDRGWLVDYLHCPFEEPVHRNKDCSAAQLRRRIETVVSEGSDEVWLARVEEVVDYRYVCRCAKVESVPAEAGRTSWRIAADDVHPAVTRYTLTWRLPEGATRATLDGRPIEVAAGLVDIDMSRPHILSVVQAGSSTETSS